MKPAWDDLAKKADASVVTVADVDCTAAGQPICQKMGVQGYPTIKYCTEKTGKSCADYQGGRDFASLKKFLDTTFKASCDAKTQKGCNDQEKRFIDKVKDKTYDELLEEKKTKETELKDFKKEKNDAEKEWKETQKKHKRKEMALNKAIGILKQLEISKKKSGEKEKKDEL